MKLKKIASLMLAGIMAVSMLAGCGEASSNSTETPDVTPVTGAAAIVNGELDKNKDKVSFTENNVVAGLMEDYYEENPIVSDDWNRGESGLNTLVDTTDSELMAAVKNVVGNVPASNNQITQFGISNTDKETHVTVYMVNNDFMSRDNALRMVGKAVDGLTLPKDNSFKSTTDLSGGSDRDATHNYSYTGTISAIEAKSEGGTESVWVIAVSITQTASKK